MSDEKFMTQKEAILLKKMRLKSKEKILHEKTRKFKTKKLIELGNIITESELDHLDKATLYGALSIIKEQENNPETLKFWKTKGIEIMELSQRSSQLQLIISFPNGASDEAKKILRDNQFKWYSFRNEWYGRGNKELIGKLLENQNAKIQVVS